MESVLVPSNGSVPSPLESNPKRRMFSLFLNKWKPSLLFFDSSERTLFSVDVSLPIFSKGVKTTKAINNRLKITAVTINFVKNLSLLEDLIFLSK